MQSLTGATFHLEFPKRQCTWLHPIHTIYQSSACHLHIRECDSICEDISIITSGKTLLEAKAKAESDMASVYSWVEKNNGLVLNAAKCYNMCIVPNHAKAQTNSYDLKLGNNCSYISLVSESKIFGITISSDLKWIICHQYDWSLKPLWLFT